jgi:hypothetical protein
MKKIFCVMTLIALAGCAHLEKTNMRISEGPIAAAPPPMLYVPMSPVVQAILGYKFGDSEKPVLALEQAVRDSLATEGAQRSMASQLCAVLHTNSTLDAKDLACRQLWICGYPDNVPAIAPLLENRETIEMARYALDGIPGEEANGALETALRRAPEDMQVGLINSLANRRATSARDTLKPLVKSSNPAVAEAAKNAIDRIHG